MRSSSTIGRVFATVFVATLVVLGAIRLSAQTNTPAFDLRRIQQATVFIMQTQTIGNQPIITCVSSGTIVSRDGLILSNAHATVTSDDCPGDRLYVALAVNPDEPPVPKYQADVLQFDPGVDLALLQINREFDGRTINPGSLAFPFVELADTSSVQLDDTVTVVGYSGVGDQRVSVATSTVSGFAIEPNSRTSSWIKINTSVSEVPVTGTISGGGAYNRDGQLVGIPTTAPLASDNFGTTCRAIQDTNQDSLINQGDRCVPVGGSINVLRPISFAQPLIRSGSLGLTIDLSSQSQFASTISGAPQVDKLFFAPGITGNMPTTVISSLPTGSDALYLFFDYANMTPETTYELRVTNNGIPNPDLSIAPVRWSGGERGLWFIGTSGTPLPNGIYEFTLLINGVAAAEPKTIRIGGAPELTPAFIDIVFAIIENNQRFGNGYVLGAGSTASAQFLYNNMENGLPWAAIWYFNGDIIPASRIEETWASPSPNGARDISIISPDGLLPGNYRLELYINNRLSALADFVVAGATVSTTPRAFTEPVFIVAQSESEATTASPVSSVTNPVNALYARFDWEQIAPGTLWRMRWSIDGTVFFDQTIPWTNRETGSNFLTRIAAPDELPDGTYRVELFLNDFQLVGSEIEIGIGQLPLDPFAEAEGIQFRGQIIDADTRLGIPNVSIVMIGEEFSVADYVAEAAQTYDIATTDRNGLFVFDRPLQLDTPYSIIIEAQGYLPISADAFTLDSETPNPFDMTIYLTSD